VPQAARWRPERDASPGGATRLANCAEREISRFLLSESVALLRSAQCVKPQIDTGEILNQRTVILPWMPRPQARQQLAVDLHTRRRGRHTTSLSTTGHIRDGTHLVLSPAVEPQQLAALVRRERQLPWTKLRHTPDASRFSDL
jgi:hypothetical protein